MMEKSSNDSIAQRLRMIEDSIHEQCIRCNRSPDEVSLMAVTKTVSAQRVNEAIQAGVRFLGENRVQELQSKFELYDREGVQIHFIGHLQTNKVKYLVDKVSMIQSVDSLHLAQQIDKECAKHGKIMDILLEVNIGREESKSGLFQEELEELLPQLSQLSNLRVRGLMAIPPRCENQKELEKYFYQMQQLFIDMKDKNLHNITMDFLSMGMSQDYLTAIQYGSTMVRIGRRLFGERNYK